MKYTVDEFGFYSGFINVDGAVGIDTPPPADHAGLRPRWSVEGWVFERDYRGVTWFNGDSKVYEASTHPDDARGAPWIEVVDGRVTDELPPLGAEQLVFNYLTKRWEDTRALEAAKADKKRAINQASEAANQSFFVYQGKQIAVDPASRSYIDGANGAFLLLGGPPDGWPGGWKAEDNTYVPIATLDEWRAFYAAMVAAGTANFNRTQALKTLLSQAATLEEVEAVPDW